jgi:DNA-binding SARP family transcriptional activator/pimeloyl-ACP methyl ester carboxylesterase
MGRVRFCILGPLEVTDGGGRPLELRGARVRAVLAMLLVHANEAVPASRIVGELWPDQPEDRAAASLQVRLSQLRKALRAAGEPDRLVTRPPGYLIRASADEIDALRFARLTAEGGAAAAAGHAETAVARFTEALGLWRGGALADIQAAPFAVAETARMEEARLAALEALLEARLACGSHREVIGELEALTAAHPLRERLWSQRMIALYRAGRQAEALRAYGDVRSVLVSELGIEPGPELREVHRGILRQDPGLAAPARPGAVSEAPPPTRYARSDDGVHIAYQVIGDGEHDIIAVPGIISHLDLWWEDRVSARFFRRLASLGRLIMFDKRDTGLSDRTAGPSTLQQRMTDVQAVMRACGSQRATLFGYSEGGPMSLLFAATYPQRVRSLILGAASARWLPAPGYPCGQQTELIVSALERLAAGRWGQGDSIELYAPSVAGLAQARQAFARWERISVSPSDLLRMLDLIRAIDVRGVLPAIHAPALVIQRADDRITPPCHGRYLAAHLAHARYFEQPGDHVLWLGDTDAMFARIEQFLDETRRP